MPKRKRGVEAATSTLTNGLGKQDKGEDRSGKSGKSLSKTAVKEVKLATQPSQDNLSSEHISGSGVTSKGTKTLNHIDSKTQQTVVQIVTGSYERVLHGITASFDQSSENESDSKPSLAQFSDTFLFNAHASAIRCLALSPVSHDDPSQGVYLATGGSDEKINIYSISASPLPEVDRKGRPIPTLPTLGSNQISENPRNRELGTLVQHSSSITALHFPTRGKLLSASEDNTISISRCRDLSVVSTVKAPRPKAVGQPSGDTNPVGSAPAGINDFSIHPSMKLMVSVGKGERSMRLWNLVTGKKAGVLNFDRDVLQSIKEGKYSSGEGRRIKWNAAGTEFAVSFERGIVIFGQGSRARATILPQPLTKVHQFQFLDLGGGHERIALSTEDGRILFYDGSEEPLLEGDGEDPAKATALPAASLIAALGGKRAGLAGRIKDFKILSIGASAKATGVTAPPDHLVVAASSDGNVRLWRVSASALTPKKGEELKDTVGTLIGTYETGSRITCLDAFVMLPAEEMDEGLSEFEGYSEAEGETEGSSVDE